MATLLARYPAVRGVAASLALVAAVGLGVVLVSVVRLESLLESAFLDSECSWSNASSAV
jgi:hypothetical protein